MSQSFWHLSNAIHWECGVSLCELDGREMRWMRWGDGKRGREDNRIYYLNIFHPIVVIDYCHSDLSFSHHSFTFVPRPSANTAAFVTSFLSFQTLWLNEVVRKKRNIYKSILMYLVYISTYVHEMRTYHSMRYETYLVHRE